MFKFALQKTLGNSGNLLNRESLLAISIQNNPVTKTDQLLKSQKLNVFTDFGNCICIHMQTIRYLYKYK